MTSIDSSKRVTPTAPPLREDDATPFPKPKKETEADPGVPETKTDLELPAEPDPVTKLPVTNEEALRKEIIDPGISSKDAARRYEQNK